jgi:hypothetical protein
MRAVRIIAKLVWKYKHEDVAAALLKHCSRKDRRDAALAGQFLVDLWDLNHKAESEAPRCCECGEDILEIKSPAFFALAAPRADARYCSAKCRTRAYRKRVTASRPGERRKRHAEAQISAAISAATAQPSADVAEQNDARGVNGGGTVRI